MTQRFGRTLVELLRYRSIEQSDRTAFSFLLDGEDEQQTWTYATLDTRARSIAAMLQSQGFTGQRASLLYPPGLEYIAAFFGCLYAGVIAVPAYPPRPNESLRRLEQIAEDAQATVSLTQASSLPALERHRNDGGPLGAVRPLATDVIPPEMADEWREERTDTETLALLQYTSGSTSTPKGVMVTHGNLMHNLGHIYASFGHSEESRGVIWLPPYHDMGLIGGILQPLYGGFPVTLMSPFAFIQKPVRWLQTISDSRATSSGGPDFAYDLCVRKVTPEQRDSLDLSSWNVAFTGAEPIRSETLDRFTDYFGPCGFRKQTFYPCYGLAEGTLLVTGGAKDSLPVVHRVQAAALEANRAAEPGPDEMARTVVGCGQTLSDQTVAVVRPDSGTECAEDEVGEIWVSGPSIARGYWNRPEVTVERFHARLPGCDRRFLRTGDLGFVRGGELFVTGRLKDLIIIRGRNHYPQDIEETVQQSHYALRPDAGAAFSVEVDGAERLVVVQELERQYRRTDPNEVAAAIRAAVSAHHDLQVYTIALIKPASIPKTSSGKIQRHRCRDAYRSGTLDLIATSLLELDAEVADGGEEPTGSCPPREVLLKLPAAEAAAHVEAYLLARTARLLGIKPAALHATTALNTVGLDSLQAVELQSSMEAQFAVVVPLPQLLGGASVRELAGSIMELVQVFPEPEAPPLSAAPEQTDLFPLSGGQRALWFLHRLAPQSAAYNLSVAVSLTGEVYVQALERSFQALVDRQPALRTTFHQVDGEPMQRVQPSMRAPFTVSDAADWDEQSLQARLVEEANRPFDLERAPLLRINLYTRNGRPSILLLVIHHIIADFWSLGVLVEELRVLYPAAKLGTPGALPALPAQYADYVRWQSETLSGAVGQKLRAYWHTRLAGPLPVLNLPTDRPRPSVQTYRGASHLFELVPALRDRVHKLAAMAGTTVYTVLLSAFQVLLHRYTGQEDILVGTPAAGRSRRELAGLVGYFVNPVVLRGDLSGNPTFAQLLERNRQVVLGALEHQEYPFLMLVERLQLDRDPSRSPLFQVMFTYQQKDHAGHEALAALAIGKPGARIDIGEMQWESMSLPEQVAQFDLRLMMTDEGGLLAGALQYNTDLFEAGTVARMIEHFEVLLAGCTENAREAVGDLPLLPPAELRLLEEWNDTGRDYRADVNLHTLFEQQADRTPDAIALSFEGVHLTYRELDRRASLLAHCLQDLGVGPEVIVGVYVERSLEMVIALLGVLKAGGAYLPLDPSDPRDRLAFMLEDSGVGVLLTTEGLASTLPDSPARVICLDTNEAVLSRRSPDRPRSAATPDNLAYIIYTSGSTGKPKGAMNTHRAICNRLFWMQEAYCLTSRDSVLQKTPFSFDVSVWEFLWPLLNGARLVMARPGGHQDCDYLVDVMKKERITVLHFVPSMLQAFLSQTLPEVFPALRHVICSGEALPCELPERFFSRFQAELHNLYGPTEAAVDVTYWPCAGGDHRHTVPIGRPVANTRIYILDRHLRPTPVGVPGELHIGGVQVGRGYLNRPGLTAEKFIADPFAPVPGGRLYHTGDLARYLPDGTIEFLGRIDHQVKVRGLRIELGEVESALVRHPQVREALVVAGNQPGDEQRLVAYLVGDAFAQPTAADLRSFLKRWLPEYMVPNAFCWLEAMPLLPNGKIDRRALPDAESAVSESRRAYVAPRNEPEAVIARVWQEVLGVDRVGVHDRFFDLGGHSLLVVRIQGRLKEAFGRDIPIVEMFRHTTVAALAEYLGKTAAPQLSAQRMQQRAEQQREALRLQQQLALERRNRR